MAKAIRTRKQTGNAGEDAAAQFLMARGYQIIDTGVRPEGGMARGELDIVAWHDGVLCFVEVKTRRQAFGPQGSPAEAVDERKRRQLTALAEAYIAKHELDDVPCRFDVVEVVLTDTLPPRCSLLAGAFTGTD